MERLGRVALGSAAGGALAFVLSPFLSTFFEPPQGGVGYLTVHSYPKGFDYALVAILALGACAGGVVAAWRTATQSAVAETFAPRRAAVWITSLIVFVMMFFIHDHPRASLDPFHDGEHLTPGFLFRSGEAPFGDVFVLHGLGTDGGLDALVMGEPPSALRARRFQNVLDAATLALLVPIAAELTVTLPGLVAAVFLSLCGAAAFILPVFPYFRLLPVLLATLGLLRFSRRGSAGALLLAFSSGTLGILWSLDTGMYALVGTAVAVVVIRVLRLEQRPMSWMHIGAMATIAAGVPFLLLVAVRADLPTFISDSFVVIPASIDAVWSRPAPPLLSPDSTRYYLPPLFYGFVLALSVLAWRRGNRITAANLLTVGVMSLMLFRTAAGRTDLVTFAGFGAIASHTRYAVPLLGLCVIATVVEPLMRSRARWVVITLVIPLLAFFQVGKNVAAAWQHLSGWGAREDVVAWEVPYPFPVARDLYTSSKNAGELRALDEVVRKLPPGPILDFTNERVLYFLLQRKPPMRCFDIPMLSVPSLRAEAMAQLRANPPVGVILGGDPGVAVFDQIPNSRRVPELAAWIDALYPVRTKAGRFIVATPRVTPPRVSTIAPG